MPEIKNTFSQGKMNKDLDERLIPNGQYEDALNIDVITSDGSDAGIAKNIMGNSRVDNLISNGACVGAVTNEMTNKLYWFVKLMDRDVIVEYDHNTKQSSFIAVDLHYLAGIEGYDGLKPFLKFTGKQITGINIIDDFLFWTDGESEPKKINVEKAPNHVDPMSIDLHSRLYIDGEDKGYLEEDHVTVIRKKPSIAPTFKINSATANPSDAIFEKIFPRFCFRYKYRDGEYSAFGPFTEVVFNAEYGNLVNVSNSYSVAEPYNKAMSNIIKSIDLYDFIPSDIPNDVVQVDILYKQEDSNVVYSVTNIKYTDPEWSEYGSAQDQADNTAQNFGGGNSITYGELSNHRGRYRISTENIHAALPENQLLRPWDNVPKKAYAQEVVGNRIVYGNYLQGYDIKSDEGVDLTPKVLADYGLRSIQDFGHGGLKSIKSSRDYQVGILLGDAYGRETPVFTSSKGNVKINWTSSLNGKNASLSNMITASLPESLPSWAEYYRFYIKQTSGEYYNLIMDKVYVPPKHVDFHEDHDHVWMSFPSADRNKIMEDDFIIAKKRFDGTADSQVAIDNKYKILDIKNEAPEAVKYTFSILGSVKNGASAEDGQGEDVLAAAPDGEGETDVIFPFKKKRIDKTTKNIVVDRAKWVSPVVNGATLDRNDWSSESKDIFISWELLGHHSERYRVSSINHDATPDLYNIKLSKEISAIDAGIANDPDDDNKLAELLIFKVERRDVRPPEQFSGKFFVKTKDNPDLLTFAGDGSTQDQTFVSASHATYWLHETPQLGGSPGSEVDDAGNALGVVNSNLQYDTSDNVEDTVDNISGALTQPAEWAALKTHFDTQAASINDGVSDNTDSSSANKGTFFIDSLSFVASNPSTSSYAKESGEGWSGAQTIYQNYVWGDQSYHHFQTSGFSGTYPLHEHYAWVIPETINNRGLAPAVYPTEEGGDIVNSMEGLITSSETHSGGPRRWLTSTIHDGLAVEQANPTYGAIGSEGHYLHLSFLAPGIDLHDGFTPAVTGQASLENDLIGFNSMAKDLQGIWGGGVFTKTPNGSKLTSQSESEADDEWHMFGNSSDGGGYIGVDRIEFEGNYVSGGVQGPVSFNGPTDNIPQTDVFSYGIESTPSPEQGQGYDENYRDRHENQWKPSYVEGADGSAYTNNEIKSFVDRVKSVGTKFRFSNDPDGEVYTIENVEEKHLYNHTSWRMRWFRNPDGEYMAAGLQDPDNASGDIDNIDTSHHRSVEEAASAWAETFTRETIGPGNSFSSLALGNVNFEDPQGEALKRTIENFGAAHNRRVCYIIKLDKNPADHWNPLTDGGVDGALPTDIEFVASYPVASEFEIQSYPTIWETEPQQLTNLNIYYEISDSIPTKLTNENAEVFAPIGCNVVMIDNPNPGSEIEGVVALAEGREPGSPAFDYAGNRRLINWDVIDGVAGFQVNHAFPSNLPDGGESIDYAGAIIRFIREDGGYTTCRLVTVEYDYPNSTVGATYKLDAIVDASLDVGLSWYNCFSFGDGVESNRIRDEFNKMQITSGARASATLEEPYTEEHRKYGLIYSGMYNSNSGVNNLNQFIQAEKITKDLNPTYGSIQKLFTRSTDLVALCEDRILKILANKDALFNADGNPQLVASQNVLGQAVPFSGDFGISKNPESFAAESYRAYFADKQRGAVLRLSMDGLTPISDAGMRDYFRDNLSEYTSILGSYDDYSKQYNITMNASPLDNANIIINTNFTDGAEDEEYFNDSILQNSDPITGVPFVPSLSFDEIYTTVDGSLKLQNMSLDSSTEIRNHAPLYDVYDETSGETVDIAEWVEVIHNPVSGGWTSTTSNTTFGNTDQYGPEILGEVVSVTDADGNSYQYYQPKADNPEPTDQTPAWGDYVNDGDNTYIGVSSYTYAVLPVEGNSSKIHWHPESFEQTSGFIQQPILSNPFVADRWYLVDIETNLTGLPQSSYNNIWITSALAGVGEDGADANPLLEGSFGEIKVIGETTGQTNGLKLLPTTRTEYGEGNTEVLRGIFKVSESSGLMDQNNTTASPTVFKIGGYKPNIVINSITLMDITSEASGGIADNWYTLPNNYSASGAQEPEVYLADGGAITWNTTSSDGKCIKQNFSVPQNPHPNPVATEDGWELSFKIGSLAGVGIAGSLRGYVSGDPVDGLGFGFENITESNSSYTNSDGEVVTGSYVIKGNFDGTSEVEILKDGVFWGQNVTVDNIQGLSFVQDTEGYFNQATGRIYFEPGEEGFSGHIQNITLRDTTNYFQSGDADQWNIIGNPTGIDPFTGDIIPLESYISWDNPGQIVFSNCPPTANINQNIGNIPNGQVLALAFDYVITEGNISGYYYNSSSGKGFEFSTDDNLPGAESYASNVTIGSSSTDGVGVLYNTLVITSSGGSLSGTIDNPSLTRIIYDVNPQTVSFNEDVKGWTSFKSFIPEGGASVSSQYFTIKNGGLWQHNTNETRNLFYGHSYESTITAILNNTPSTVKNFNTINYEGSQAAIKAYGDMVTTVDGEDVTLTTLSTYNAFTQDKKGWAVERLETDLQKGFINEFIEKDGKWFNYIKGLREEIDTSEFSFQGLGTVQSITPE